MKVFISHATNDNVIAHKVVESLQEEGIEYWSANESLFLGDNWADAVSKALRDSDAMIVIASPNTMNSPYAAHEIGYALGSQKYENRIFPILVPNGNSKISYESLPWILRHIQAMTLPIQSKDQEKSLKNFVKRLKQIEVESSSKNLVDVSSDIGK